MKSEIRIASGKRPALKLVNTTSTDREKWLITNGFVVGSQDAAAAVGRDPSKSRLALWMEKTGRAASVSPGNTKGEMVPRFWKSILEPIVVAQYTKRSGNKVKKVNRVLQPPDPDLQWMTARQDREVSGSDKIRILMSLSVGLAEAGLWKEGPPEYIRLEAMHLLAVSGEHAVDLAVLIGGEKLEIHRIERDEELVAALIQLESEFWHCVVSDTPPPADGSDSSSQALQHLYPVTRPRCIDLRQNPNLNMAYVELKALKQTILKHRKREALLTQQLQLAIGSASRALLAGGEISWTCSGDTTVLDVDQLIADRPNLKARYSRLKKGDRTFTIN